MNNIVLKNQPVEYILKSSLPEVINILQTSKTGILGRDSNNIDYKSSFQTTQIAGAIGGNNSGGGIMPFSIDCKHKALNLGNECNETKYFKELNNIYTTYISPIISKYFLHKRFFVIEIADYSSQALSNGYTDFVVLVYFDKKKIPQRYIGLIKSYYSKMCYILIDRTYSDAIDPKNNTENNNVCVDIIINFKKNYENKDQTLTDITNNLIIKNLEFTNKFDYSLFDANNINLNNENYLYPRYLNETIAKGKINRQSAKNIIDNNGPKYYDYFSSIFELDYNIDGNYDPYIIKADRNSDFVSKLNSGDNNKSVKFYSNQEVYEFIEGTSPIKLDDYYFFSRPEDFCVFEKNTGILLIPGRDYSISYDDDTTQITKIELTNSYTVYNYEKFKNINISYRKATFDNSDDFPLSNGEPTWDSEKEYYTVDETGIYTRVLKDVEPISDSKVYYIENSQTTSYTFKDGLRYYTKDNNNNYEQTNDTTPDENKTYYIKNEEVEIIPEFNSMRRIRVDFELIDNATISTSFIRGVLKSLNIFRYNKCKINKSTTRVYLNGEIIDIGKKGVESNNIVTLIINDDLEDDSGVGTINPINVSLISENLNKNPTYNDNLNPFNINYTSSDSIRVVESSDTKRIYENEDTGDIGFKIDNGNYVFTHYNNEYSNARLGLSSYNERMGLIKNEISNTNTNLKKYVKQLLNSTLSQNLFKMFQNITNISYTLSINHEMTSPKDNEDDDSKLLFIVCKIAENNTLVLVLLEDKEAKSCINNKITLTPIHNENGFNYFIIPAFWKFKEDSNMGVKLSSETSDFNYYLYGV